MITITPEAAAQIRKALEQTGAADMCLRLAVRREDDGSFEYGMGFDDRKDTDLHLNSEGIDVVISDSIKEFLMGAVLDYVEISPGEHQFIFKNPNDPAHTASPQVQGNGPGNT